MLDDPHSTPAPTAADSRPVIPGERDEVDFDSFRKAYEAAHPMLHARIDASYDRRGRSDLRGLELQLKRLAKNLPEYPTLLMAVMRSQKLRQAELLNEATLDKLRKFTARRIYHHTQRGGERIAQKYGVDNEIPVLTQLLHDEAEDGGVSIAEIREMFGPIIEMGVRALTIKQRKHSTVRVDDM